MANQSQLSLIRQGAEVWNEFVQQQQLNTIVSINWIFTNLVNVKLLAQNQLNTMRGVSGKQIKAARIYGVIGTIGD